MSLTSIIGSTLAATSLVVSLSAASVGQSRSSAPPAAPTCMTLLTPAEITKAAGAEFQDMGSEAGGAGETSCPWMRRGGADGSKTVSLQFFDLKAVAATPIAPTLAKFFELYVSAAEGSSNVKREPIAGVGQQATFVATDPQMLAIVQRADGVARIVTNNLTKAQVIDIARAVAAPIGR